LLPQSDYTQLPQSSKHLNVAVPSTPHFRNLERLKSNYNSLDEYDKESFLSLLRFPENAVIKKQNIYIWWKQLGLDYFREVEDVFRKLREYNLIVPHGHVKCPVESKFKINPGVRHQSLWSFLQNEERQFSKHRVTYHSFNMCLQLYQPNFKISDVKTTRWQSVLNISASYLNFESQWIVKMKKLEVLQLGRWLHESAKHHIEVQSEEFLKELRDQKYLKYLSLRGISRIFELPPSILQLESLETLDLKACHNLETLPNDIASLRNLKYLNLSECYLLDRMPKGIDKLSELEVLKGFVIGSSSKTPCRISDITNLKKLKRLSIHITSGAVIQDREFESLKELEELEHLKISWGVSDTRYSDISIDFPSSLIKLHVEGFPGQNILEWLNKCSEPLLTLKELNITGGKVSSMNYGKNYRRLEIIRLKYLKYLDVKLTYLGDLFPSLMYVEIKQHLVTEEKKDDLKDLKFELNNIKDLFSIVKRNEEELLDTLTVVDGYLRNSNIRKLKQEEKAICERIRISKQKLLPTGGATHQSSNIEVSQEKTFQHEKLDKGEEMNKALSPQSFKVHYNDLDRLHKRFFLSLLLFPKNAIIKKNTLHFWWASVVGYIMIGQFEFVFEYLFDRKLIVPHGNGKCPVVSKFKINPCIHHMLVWPMLQNDEEQLCDTYSKLIAFPHRNASHPSLLLDQPKVKLSDRFGFKTTHCRAVFNVGASYLNFEPQWMVKMKHLEVLQLGRWLHDSPQHHIEVENEEFFKELKDQKNLKYLSLRGMSRIFELPPLIFQLKSLAILDLKACHNLETLPDDISSLRNLRHLDLSQCYLLDRMPNGIEKLHNLEVLKGFQIASSRKTPYRISDLANLGNLERLSIHIGSGAVIQSGEFESLQVLLKLEHLKISWIVSDTRYNDIQISLPLKLTKLHLEGFPGESIPEWLKPSKLPERLKELNLTGGKLKFLDHGENDCRYTCLEILRLKYLKYLNVDTSNLQELFPSLKYAEIKQVKNIEYFEF
ncbi:Disease resistance RPP13-like protein 4, partial [Mucuna pruriens]